MRKLTFIAKEDIKVEKLLLSKGFSRSVITELKGYPFSMVASGRAVRTVDTVKKGAPFTVTLGEPSPVFSGLLPLVFENKDVIAVLKPSNMPTHSSKGHRNGGTLGDEFSAGVYRPLYRLDKDTEGIVLIAKNSHAVSVKRTVKKLYFGVCEGVTDQYGVIDAPIYDDGSVKRVISDMGKRAVTRYRRLLYKDGYSLLCFYLETGRTHQIRLHTAHMGHALLGDSVYGSLSEKYPHQLLFMGYLEFCLLDGEKIKLKAPFPEAFKEIFGDIDFLLDLNEGNSVLAFTEGAEPEGADRGV